MKLQLTPRQIVKQLDQFIVGQHAAKRSVAIALRNRWRRQQTPDDVRKGILPNNIILIGPTGVGKTEIARRMAELAGAPFLKVEASKYTEVGYVGRDVESMIRDLVNAAVLQVKGERQQQIASDVALEVEKKIQQLLKSTQPKTKQTAPRKSVRAKRNDSLDDPDERIVDLEVQSSPQSVIEVFSPQGTEELGINMQELLGTLIPKRSEKRQLTVAAARRYLQQEMYATRINMDQVVTEALDRVQQLGVIFIDEIDKIVGSGNASGPDVSREGVQRDILPIVEGAAVTTRYGTVRTDHILFIAAGAFHGSSPSDLIPELQGRFPIRVELEELSSSDLSRILVEPQHSLLKQYEALLSVEGVSLKLAKSAVTEIAAYAEKINSQTENIGARRLQTIMATILEDYLFSPPTSGSTVTITADLVKKKLEPISKDQDLSKYIL